MSMNPSKKNQSAISRLKKVVAILRHPETGCEWDKIQTHQSLIPYVLEEAHEVAHAIRQRKDSNLREELGDLLLQVILHSEIASEDNRFNFEEVAECITEKLIRRHPHIFTKDISSTKKEHVMEWDEIKEYEKNYSYSETPFTDKLREKVRPQPALFSANYISRKTSQVGFDWKSIDEVWCKLDEEIQELKEALKLNDLEHAEEELGDALFTIINIARWYKLNPEEGLCKTNNKFLDRFSFIEKELKGDIKNNSIEKLSFFWEKAKSINLKEKKD